jgi:hypothetical protein
MHFAINAHWPQASFLNLEDPPMPPRLNRLPMLLVPAVILAMGCGGDDGTGPEGSNISDAQAQNIAFEVTSASINALNSGTGEPAVSLMLAGAGAASAIPIRFDYSHTESCPLFGRIGVTGTMSGSIDDQGSGALWLQVTETLTDCTFSSNNGDLVINGDPSLSLTGTFTFLGGSPGTQQSLTLSGGFRWSFDGGGSGFCAINLTLNLATAGSGTTTVSGTVCGRQVNY